jgi:hypothetical protein
LEYKIKVVGLHQQKTIIMKKQNLILIANQILKSKNYRFQFNQIQVIPKDILKNRNDVYTMGEIDGYELWYTMATLPSNFIFTGKKLYQLF